MRGLAHQDEIDKIAMLVVALDLDPHAQHRHQQQMKERDRRGDAVPAAGYGRQTHTPPSFQVPDAPWVNRDWRNADGGAFDSPVRPPMSSDIPHPRKLLNPKNKHQAEMLAHALASEDPEHDPWNVLGGSGQTFEHLAQNHLNHLNQMSPEESHSGRQWYRAAHEGTKDLADKTMGDHGRTVATMSAFSPQNDWDTNVEQGHHFITHYNGDPNFTMSALGPSLARAKQIYHARGDAWQGILHGPKTSAFSNNILDATPMRAARPGVEDDDGFYDYPTNPYTGEPDWRLHPDQDLTLDTHHVRMANTSPDTDLRGLKYDVPEHFAKPVVVNKQDYHPGYDLYARAAWEATRRRNAAEPDALRHLIPKQGQAGPWVKFRHDLDRVSRKAGSPESGVAPRSWPADATPEAVAKWKKQHPLKNPAPRYQRDLGPDEWEDPRRPHEDLRQTPNWGRRPTDRDRTHFGALELASWWRTVLARSLSAVGPNDSYIDPANYLPPAPGQEKQTSGGGGEGGLESRSAPALTNSVYDLSRQVGRDMGEKDLLNPKRPKSDPFSSMLTPKPPAGVPGVPGVSGTSGFTNQPTPPGSGSERWRSLVHQTLENQKGQYGITDQNLSTIENQELKQIQTESGGNPSAINNYDSNAQAGHPSQGVLQFIPSTFNSYNVSHGQFTDPGAQIAAFAPYVSSRYGIDPASGGYKYVGQGHGY